MEDKIHELEKQDLKDIDENDTDKDKKKFKLDMNVLSLIDPTLWHVLTGVFGLWVAYALCFDWVIPLVAQMLRGAGGGEDNAGRRLTENVLPTTSSSSFQVPDDGFLNLIYQSSFKLKSAFKNINKPL